MLLPNQFLISPVRTCGTGGLGTVDEVVVIETNNSHPVGTHLARKRLNAKWKDYPNARERFEREIRTISAMRHPAIISFEGQNLPGDERFYVMPVYPGSMRDLLNANPTGFAWRDVARFGSTLADALAYAHGYGYIHRDLKPENILLDANNTPVISDWGLGYFVHQYSKVLDLTHGGMGTEYYCSLEQWTTGKCQETGDVYSLGIVLAEMVRGVSRARIIPGLGLQEDIVPEVGSASRTFNAYLRKMTTAVAISRPQQMRDVKTQLVRFSTAHENSAISFT